MKPNAPKRVVVSETSFAHFIRSAPQSEKERRLNMAMKAAAKEQREIIEVHNQKKAGRLAPA